MVNRYKAYNDYWGRYLKISLKRDKPLAELWWDITSPEIHWNRPIPKYVVENGKIRDIKTREDYLNWYDFSLKPITDKIDSDTDCIIEFGSGWGRNIFFLINKLKRKDIDYYAFEYTPSGKQVSDNIKEMIPEYNIYTDLFDYNNPKFELKKKYKKILIFTRHSIEQVNVLKPEFLNKLLDIDAKYDVVHQEPIGWQIDTEQREKWNQRDRNFSKFKRKYFNTNLFPMLKDLESKKRITILNLIVDYSSYRQEWNSTTVVHWKKT